MSTESHNVDADAEVDGTEADKINTGALGTLVAVGLFAMISITAAVTALVRHDIETEEAQKDADANQVVTDLKAAQRGALEAPASYVNRVKGTVTLPIDLAKGLVVSELSKDPSSATPPAPIQAAAGAAAVDGSGGAATLASGGASGGANKPEQGRKIVESGGSTKAIVPKPSPTAATPGAESPGPINH